MIVEAVTTLGGMLLPSVMDIFKRKILGGSEAGSMESALTSLACTKPEAIPAYIEAMAKAKTAEVEYFKRDMDGETSRWVNNLRACIRPTVTVVAVMVLAIGYFGYFNLDEATRATFCTVVGSWFGTRLEPTKK